jgi:hypothetical protein
VHHNVGKLDGWVRGSLAVAFLIVALVLIEQVVFSLLAALAALVLGATAIMRHCPLYEIFRHTTRPGRSHP